MLRLNALLSDYWQSSVRVVPKACPDAMWSPAVGPKTLSCGTFSHHPIGAAIFNPHGRERWHAYALVFPLGDANPNSRKYPDYKPLKYGCLGMNLCVIEDNTNVNITPCPTKATALV